MQVLRFIELRASEHINSWKFQISYLQSQFVEIAYALIQHIPLEDSSVKDIYKYKLEMAG